MPVRFLRPGLTTSEKWNSLDWMSQSFYVRLITLVDDYGRYEANTLLLKSHAFPLTNDINCKQVFNMCENIQKAGLAMFYTNELGKNYLQLTNWHEKPRSEPKYPEFDNTCKQMFTYAINCSPPKPSPSPSPSPYDYTEDFKKAWNEYPNKSNKSEAFKSWKRLKPNEELQSIIFKAIQDQKKWEQWKKDGGAFIPHFSTWLNKVRWQDESTDKKAIKKHFMNPSEIEAQYGK